MLLQYRDHTGSLILLNTVQTLEYAEEFVGILHIKAHTFDKIYGLAICLLTADLDLGGLLLASKFEGISKLIQTCLAPDQPHRQEVRCSIDISTWRFSCS